MDTQLDLNSLLQKIFDDHALISAVLSGPKDKESPQKITVKPVTIQGQIQYQASLQIEDKVIHQNYHSQQCCEFLKKLSYKQILLFTDQSDYQILISKKGKATILRKPPSKGKSSLEHNRKKNYLIEQDAPFLVELGINRQTGKMQEKFRQVNRFIELFDDLIKKLPPRKTWHIVDFGCGKAYLTFGIYHYMQSRGLSVNMLGLDLKEDVVKYCNDLAKKLGYHTLKFKVGDINQHTPDAPVDIMVSLHACDTATDAALEKAIRWKADGILCAPCCQHELYSQVANASLDPLLKHGILRERFAALATDAARSLLLEILGYKTQVIEFIDAEDTPKNLMIRAIRDNRNIYKKELIEKYLEFKKTLSITPALERKFHNDFEF